MERDIFRIWFMSFLLAIYELSVDKKSLRVGILTSIEWHTTHRSLPVDGINFWRFGNHPRLKFG
jgi:hypothetical protein